LLLLRLWSWGLGGRERSCQWERRILLLALLYGKRVVSLDRGIVMRGRKSGGGTCVAIAS
jgi:hypothetical protein